MREIIEKHISTYFLAEHEGKSYVLLYMPYVPFADPDIKYFSAYYLASNKLYATTKALEDELGATRYKGNLKKLFADTGFGRYLRNTLIALPGYGSLVVLAALELNGHYEQSEAISPPACIDCNACVSACPSGALADGFNRELCIRHAQNNPDESPEIARLSGNMVLGCERCQTACPLNTAERQEIPAEIKSVLERRDLDTMALLIGKNFIPILDKILHF
jgi:ferredoxin